MNGASACLGRAVLVMLAGCGYISSAERDKRWDLDGDGVERPRDCDDRDATISSDEVERCDLRDIDEDCDGQSDDDDSNAVGPFTLFCLDRDGDGLGDPLTGQSRCDPPAATDEIWLTDCSDPEDLPSNTETTECGASPRAIFEISETCGDLNTLFAADASASTGEGLTYTLSWGDGSSELLASPVASHSYSESGLWHVSLEVTDRCARTARDERLVAVSEAGQLLRVSTAVDEDDGETWNTLAGWSGDGLSLREALQIANDTAGSQVICFSDALSTVSFSSGFPSLDDEGGILFGAGITIDGSDGGWLKIKGMGAVIADVVFDGFTETKNGALQLWGEGSIARGVTVKDSAIGIEIDGMDAKLADSLIIGSADNQLNIRARATIERLVVRDGGTVGISIKNGGAGTSLSLCQVSNNAKDGLRVEKDMDDISFSDGSIVGNGEQGIQIESKKVERFVLRNTLLAFNGSYGVLGESADFAAGSPDHNLWYANGQGACSDCAALGAGAVEIDPMLTDWVSGDLAPLPGSPVIDAGSPSTLYDRNGSAPGLWFGSAPDIGAIEIP